MTRSFLVLVVAVAAACLPATLAFLVPPAAGPKASSTAQQTKQAKVSNEGGDVKERHPDLSGRGWGFSFFPRLVLLHAATARVLGYPGQAMVSFETRREKGTLACCCPFTHTPARTTTRTQVHVVTTTTSSSLRLSSSPMDGGEFDAAAREEAQGRIKELVAGNKVRGLESCENIRAEIHMHRE